jgi:hypothetical protein
MNVARLNKKEMEEISQMAAKIREILEKHGDIKDMSKKAFDSLTEAEYRMEAVVNNDYSDFD